MSEVITRRRRRTSYSEALADRVCEAIATSSCGLKKVIEADPTLPSESSVYQWLKVHGEFRQAYQMARERQADMLLAECIAIADDCSGDLVQRTGKDGAVEYVGNPTAVARSKVRIDTRLKVVALLAPRKYGAKPDTSIDWLDQLTGLGKTWELDDLIC